MGDRIMQKLVLRENCLVAAFHLLVRLREPFIPKSLLVNVFNLSCNDIDSLVVVFVNGGNFLGALVHLRKLLHGRCLVYDRCFSQSVTRLHQILLVLHRSGFHSANIFVNRS